MKPSGSTLGLEMRQEFGALIQGIRDMRVEMLESACLLFVLHLLAIICVVALIVPSVAR